MAIINDRSMLLFHALLTVMMILVKGHGNCPTGLPDTQLVVEYSGKCYQFVYDEKKWPAARDFCWENGGRLVKIPDAETNSFITSTLNSITDWDNNGVWTGLHDRATELRFDWIGRTPEDSDERMTWSNWAPDHPEDSWKDCVRMVRQEDWRWKMTFCSNFLYKYKFICEYDPILTPKPSPPSIPTNPPSSARPVIPDGAAQGGNNDVFSKQTGRSTPIPENDFNGLNALFSSELGNANSPGKAKKMLHGDESTKDDDMGAGTVAGIVGSIVAAIAVVLVIVLIALRRRRHSSRRKARPVSPPAPEDVGCAAKAPRSGTKTVTYCLEDTPGRPGNLYVDHVPERAGEGARAPGTPHPRVGTSFPATCGAAGGEEDGYMVPRHVPCGAAAKGASGYTPIVAGKQRGGYDPLPDCPSPEEGRVTPVTPAPTPVEDGYESPVGGVDNNTYECIDEVLDKIKDLKANEPSSSSSDSS